MSIHADDVVIAIRQALLKIPTCPAMTDVRYEPNPAQGWPNRDGRLQFDAVGRDWIRGFRITVEAIEIAEIELGDEPNADGTFNAAPPAWVCPVCETSYATRPDAEEDDVHGCPGCGRVPGREIHA